MVSRSFPFFSHWQLSVIRATGTTCQWRLLFLNTSVLKIAVTVPPKTKFRNDMSNGAVQNFNTVVRDVGGDTDHTVSVLSTFFLQSVIALLFCIHWQMIKVERNQPERLLSLYLIAAVLNSLSMRSSFTSKYDPIHSFVTMSDACHHEQGVALAHRMMNDDIYENDFIPKGTARSSTPNPHILNPSRHLQVGDTLNPILSNLFSGLLKMSPLVGVCTSLLALKIYVIWFPVAQLPTLWRIYTETFVIFDKFIIHMSTSQFITFDLAIKMFRYNN